MCVLDSLHFGISFVALDTFVTSSLLEDYFSSIVLPNSERQARGKWDLASNTAVMVNFMSA